MPPEAEKITLAGSLDDNAANEATANAAALEATKNADSFAPKSPAEPPVATTIPDKFQNTDGTLNQDALLKSYTELQTKMSGGVKVETEDTAETTETPEEPTNIKEAQETAEEATKSAGLDMDDLTARYAETGELTAEDYKAFEDSNISKTQVDGYIQGQQAIAQLRQMDQDTIGGDNYTDMLKWAGQDNNMTSEAIDNFDKALNGTQTEYTTAINGLKASYVAANGTGDAVVSLNGSVGASGSDGYQSKAQQVADMKSPMYASDPAFRAEVARKTNLMRTAGVR